MPKKQTEPKKQVESPRQQVDVVQLAIAKLDVQPGDTLVVKVEREMTPEANRELAKRLDDIFRDVKSHGVRVVMVDKDMQLSVVRAGDSEKR